MYKPNFLLPLQPAQTSLVQPSHHPVIGSRMINRCISFSTLLDLVDEPDLSAILMPAQSKEPSGEMGFGLRM